MRMLKDRWHAEAQHRQGPGRQQARGAAEREQQGPKRPHDGRASPAVPRLGVALVSQGHGEACDLHQAGFHVTKVFYPHVVAAHGKPLA